MHLTAAQPSTCVHRGVEAAAAVAAATAAAAAAAAAVALTAPAVGTPEAHDFLAWTASSSPAGTPTGLYTALLPACDDRLVAMSPPASADTRNSRRDAGTMSTTSIDSLEVTQPLAAACDLLDDLGNVQLSEADIARLLDPLGPLEDDRL